MFPVKGREIPVPNRLKYRQFMELGLASSFIFDLREFSPRKRASIDEVPTESPFYDPLVLYN